MKCHELRINTDTIITVTIRVVTKKQYLTANSFTTACFLLLVFLDVFNCPAIETTARARCGVPGVDQPRCQAEGCCWDEEARDNDIACYKKRK